MATLALLDDADFEEARRRRDARQRRGASHPPDAAAPRGVAAPPKSVAAPPSPNGATSREMGVLGRVAKLSKKDGFLGATTARGRVRLPHGRPREKDRGGRPVVFDVKTNKKGRLNAVNVALDRSRGVAALRGQARGALRKQREDNDAKRRAADDAKKAAAASAQEKRLAAKQQRLEDRSRAQADFEALQRQDLGGGRGGAGPATRGAASAGSLELGVTAPEFEPRDAPARSYTAMRASYYGGDAPRAPSPFAEPFYGHGAPQANPTATAAAGRRAAPAGLVLGAALPW
ncbi:VDE lipocalin domain-containing protein [Aureococcus anophagefferens]|nr:VDE lipocalin domain-containing protein [Aureococcus anophagefferens]